MQYVTCLEIFMKEEVQNFDMWNLKSTFFNRKRNGICIPILKHYTLHK